MTAALRAAYALLLPAFVVQAVTWANMPSVWSRVGFPMMSELTSDSI